MNRFIIGGILAAIVVMLASGANRLLSDRFEDSTEGARISSQPTTTNQDNGGDLGSVPIEQAGQLAQRQSEVGTNGNGISATGDSAFGNQGTVPPGDRAIISPNTTGTAGTAGGATPAPGNVIPRTGETATFPAAAGDIAPIQPSLVQPGEVTRPAPDPDLDSIPALW